MAIYAFSFIGVTGARWAAGRSRWRVELQRGRRHQAAASISAGRRGPAADLVLVPGWERLKSCLVADEEPESAIGESYLGTVYDGI